MVERQQIASGGFSRCRHGEFWVLLAAGALPVRLADVCPGRLALPRRRGAPGSSAETAEGCAIQRLLRIWQRRAESGRPKQSRPGNVDGPKTASGAAASVKNASAKSSHVVTNDEVPSHIGSTLTTAKGSNPAAPSDEQPSSDNSGAADQWKTQIQAQKDNIAQLQSGHRQPE